jgi:Ca-activated chloride channel family protein
LVAAAAAYDQPRISVDVNLVNTAFTLRDARGALPADLSKDAFEMLEDGVPQQVSFFARSVEVPLSLALIADVSGSQERFIKHHRRDLQAFLVCFGNHLRLVSDFSPSDITFRKSGPLRTGNWARRSTMRCITPLLKSWRV